MVRILNFVCVALMGFTILALYHVSEKTRVAHMELARVNAGISDGLWLCRYRDNAAQNCRGASSLSS